MKRMASLLLAALPALGIHSGTSEESWARFQKELQVDALASAWRRPGGRNWKRRRGRPSGLTGPPASISSADWSGKPCPSGAAVDPLERDGRRSRAYRLPDGTEGFFQPWAIPVSRNE